MTLIRGAIFGPFMFQCFDQAGAPVPINDWTPYAEVREDPHGDVILDLQPAITDGDNGIVTIPRIQDEDTWLLTDDDAYWDMFFETDTGERLPPSIGGPFTIQSKITNPAPEN